MTPSFAVLLVPQPQAAIETAATPAQTAASTRFQVLDLIMSFSFGDMHEHTSSCFIDALAFQLKHCLII